MPPRYTRLQVDVLPCIVNEQWQPMMVRGDPLSFSRASLTLPDNILLPARGHAGGCPEELRPSWQKENSPSGVFCATYLVESHTMCRRVNTLQSFLETNRELASSDASGVLS